MSLPSSDPPSVSTELAASREDFELFRRLLRVERLLKAHDSDVFWNHDPLLTEYTPKTGLDSGLPKPDLVPNKPLSIGHAAGMNADYNDNDEECEDDDDEDKAGDKVNEKSPVTAALFSQPVGPGTRAPQTSQRKQQNSQQKNTRASVQRQRQQQQQQQQQEQQRHRRQQQQEQQEQQQQRHHATVEKRYRSVVNSKIQQLSDLIPASSTLSPAEPNAPREDQGAEATQKVPTKSVVLDQALQYINHLVSTYEQHEAERDELRRKLQLWLDD